VGLAIGGNDNLYVANYNGDSIIKITQNKEVSVISNKVVRPYYLLYDPLSNKLFATVQGNDALIEIDTNDSKQPITTR
jgi:DNA-binding beta-propeller fold protein YncE